VPSNAHNKFVKTIKRCESLVNSYNQLQAIDQANGVAVPTPKDIVRGAVVLAVAALDTYVTDAFWTCPRSIDHFFLAKFSLLNQKFFGCPRSQ